MKAIRLKQFGLPDVLKLEEVKRPKPKEDEILIKVYASAVNPIDWKIRDGAIVPYLHVKIELPLTLGWDAAGIVEEVGSEVTDFKVGDAVYGVPNFPGDGSYAEYVAAKAKNFAKKPSSISFNEAATVSVAAVAAWDALFECADMQAGQHILVHGAGGNVGRFAVQFAKAMGAYVIGTASAKDLDFIKELGVDVAIDYKNQKFEELVNDLDIVFDAGSLGKESHVRSISVLRKNGILVSTQGYPYVDEVNELLKTQELIGKIVYGGHQSQAWLQDIAQLIDEGKVKVFINKVYPLEKVVEAHQEFKQITGRGKLVLEVIKEY